MKNIMTLNKEILVGFDDFTVDDSFNIRAGSLNQDKIAEYAELIDNLPPIRLYQVSGQPKPILIDGWHRRAAALGAGCAEIHAILVGEGDEKTARILALEANLRHGLSLTREEKAQAFLQLKKLYACSEEALSVKLGIPKTTLHDYLVLARGETPKPRKVSRNPTAASLTPAANRPAPESECEAGSPASEATRAAAVTTPALELVGSGEESFDQIAQGLVEQFVAPDPHVTPQEEILEQFLAVIAPFENCFRVDQLSPAGRERLFEETGWVSVLRKKIRDGRQAVVPAITTASTRTRLKGMPFTQDQPQSAA